MESELADECMPGRAAGPHRVHPIRDGAGGGRMPQLIRDTHDLSKLDEERCPLCASHVILKSGRFGPFIACVNYPDPCTFTRSLKKDRVPDRPSDEICKECGSPMVIKTGRFGEFLACTTYPKCKHTRPVPLGIKCPKCTVGDLAERRTKKGRNFFGCLRYPECDFSVWNRPVPEICPSCGYLGMEHKKTGDGAYRKRLKCLHEEPILKAPRRSRSRPERRCRRRRTRRERGRVGPGGAGRGCHAARDAPRPDDRGASYRSPCRARLQQLLQIRRADHRPRPAQGRNAALGKRCARGRRSGAGSRWFGAGRRSRAVRRGGPDARREPSADYSGAWRSDRAAVARHYRDRSAHVRGAGARRGAAARGRRARLLRCYRSDRRRRLARL